MKIRTKLVLAFWGIALVSILISSLIVINAIKNKYEAVEREKIDRFKNQAEVLFYNQLSELKRKLMILSSIKSFSENLSNNDLLYLDISSKSFLIENINLRTFDKNFKPVFSFKNSVSEFVNQDFLKKHILAKNENDAYLRKVNIYLVNGDIYFIGIAPIVDQKDFEILGFLVLEKKTNTPFLYFMKERVNTDIIVLSKVKRIASTIDIPPKDEKNFFKIEEFSSEKSYYMKMGGRPYLVEGFSITDYRGKDIGWVLILSDLKSMIFAQKVFFRNFVYTLLLLTFFLYIIAFFLTKRISKPILALSEATKELAKGNYDVEVKKTTKGEIGDLTDIFNQMVVSFRLQRAEILSLQRFFENILENLTLALIICNEELSINMVNNEAERIFNVSKKNVLNQSLFDVIPFLRNFVDDLVKLSYEGIPKYYDNIEYSLREDNPRILRMIFYRIILEGEEYIVIQAEDITKRIRIEERLVQANKLISIGELLSRFTHENHNIISGILGNLEVLKMKVKDDEDILEKILKVEKLVKKSLELSDGILDFSKKKKILIEKILLREVVDEVVGLLKASVLKNIKVERKYPKKQFYIRANKEKVSVVIMNLLINAKDAIEEAKRDSGEIEVGLENVSIMGNEYLVLKIKDNGVGIESEKIDKIFNSYYTTKGEKGTGLGLANVKDIIDDIGGFIKVRSELGKGSEFEIYFSLF